MILVLSAFAFWFAELSGLPQMYVIWAFSKFSHLKPWIVSTLIKLPNSLFSCPKCLSFWLGAIYFGNESRHIGTTILLAGVTSLIGIIYSRIYYKLLS